PKPRLNSPIMCPPLSLHRALRRADSFPYRDAGQPVSSELQDGCKLQTRIYELDERRKKSSQRRRRKTAGQTNETPISSHENELESDTRTAENVSNHYRPLLPDLRSARLRPIINPIHGLRPLLVSLRHNHRNRSRRWTTPLLL